MICDIRIEIPVIVDISKRDNRTRGVAQCLPAVCEVAESVIDPNSVWVITTVGDPSIEVTIAIEVPERNVEALSSP
jgi:hypothetical protein